jgi:O-antigen/teichoic acid export membrane protein
MNPTPAPHGRNTLAGTIQVFLAEALILPTGIVTLAFLTRRLGATDYGLFTLAASVVTWMEWFVSSLFARATNKCLAEAEDWRPAATTVLRLHLISSIAVAGVLFLLAEPLARGLGEPALAGYLRWFALDIPVFSLAQAHRNILIGRGLYRHRAWLSAGRWLARLVLMVALVQLGLSVTGAILACIGASVVELALARRQIQPTVLRGPGVPFRQLGHYAIPLLLSSLCLGLLNKIDLFLLKALGASAAQAGWYGAAQNLSIVPGLFALSFAPLLQSTLSRLRREGAMTHAQNMARDSLRLVLLLLPFAGLAAGMAAEIMRLLAGASFNDAAPLLQRLIFAALGSVLVAVTTAILVALDKPRWTLAVAGPMLLFAVGGHLWAIPRWGAAGAATVTTIGAWLGGGIGLAAVAWHGRVAPPVGSVLRSVALCGGAYALATVWPATGWGVLVKLPVLSGMVIGTYLLLREFNSREIALALSLVPGRRNARPI